MASKNFIPFDPRELDADLAKIISIFVETKHRTIAGKLSSVRACQRLREHVPKWAG